MPNPIRPEIQAFERYLAGQSSLSQTASGPNPSRNSLSQPDLASFEAYLGMPSGTQQVAERAVKEADEDGFFSRLYKAGTLGSAQAQANTARFFREAGATLERNIGPYRDVIRESIGLPTNETNTEAYVAELAKPTFQEVEAQKTITALQGFRTMQTSDVNGVLSGAQFVMEQMATSLPQMAPMLAAGGMGLPVMVGIQAGQVNQELAERLPDMPQDTRTSVSMGAGLMMASLDVLGLGFIFGTLSPAQVAEKAALKGLATYMTSRGFTPSLARAVQAGIGEGTTEALQEAINMAAVELSGGQMQPGEIPNRLREAFFGGAGAGGGISLAHSPFYRAPDQSPVGQTAEAIEAKGLLNSYDNKDLGTEDPDPTAPVASTTVEAQLSPPEDRPGMVAPPPDPAPAVSPVQEAVLSPVPDAPGAVPDPDIDKSAQLLNNIYERLAKLEGFDPEIISQSERLQNVLGMILNTIRSKNFLNGNIKEDDLLTLSSELVRQGAPDELVEYIDARIRQGSRRPLAKVKLPKTSVLVDEIRAYQDLRTELDKLGLYSTKFYFSQTEELASTGLYDYIRNAVFLKRTMDEGVTIGHEALHALKAIGAFNTPVGQNIWKVLSDYVTTAIPDTIFEKTNYRPKEYVEEKIAELYGQYNNVRNSVIASRRLNLPKIVVETMKLVHSGFKVVNMWVAKWSHLGEPTPPAGELITDPWDALEYIASGKIKNQVFEAIGGLTQKEVMRVTAGFARAAGKVGVERRTANNLKVMKQHADYYNFIVKWGWNVIQLAKKNPHIAFLQEYVQQANRWYNEKMAWLSRANETAAMWVNLSLKQQQALAALIFDIESMSYRTPAEVQLGTVRKPTRNELIALFAKHNVDMQKTAPVYVKMVQDFDAVLNKLEAIAVRDVWRTLAGQQVMAALEIAKINREFAVLRKRPYFPHARFGNYTVVVKDANNKTIHMEAFETERQQHKGAALLAKQYPGMTVSESFIPQEAQIFKGLPPTILMALKHALVLTPTQEQAMEQLMLQWSPTQSFRKHFIHKENIAGFSRDALRAYAEYFWHGANHIARLEYGPLLQDAIKHGEENVKHLISKGVNSTKRVQMGDFLRHHFENIMNPKPDFHQIRSLAFLWYLGFNVKSAVVNLTQVPMVTASFLSAQFGTLQTAAAISKQYTRLQATYRSPKKAAAMMKDPFESAALDQAITEGIQDESFAMELAGLAEGGNLNTHRMGGAVHKGLSHLYTWAGFAFKAAEMLNRRVTFLAALDLARSNPSANHLKTIQTQYNLELQDLITNKQWTLEQATAYLAAKDAVRSTQFEYATWARPRLMEGKKSAFFTFFMFAQNMMWFMQNSPGRTRYLLTLLGTAGLMGFAIPIGAGVTLGADDLFELVKFTGRWIFGKEWNLEKEIREQIVELTDMPPDLFLHGVSRYGFGLEHLGDMTGLPLPAVDLSGTLGMGSPLPIVSPLAQTLGRQGDFNDKLARFTSEGAGAGFGIGIGILKAFTDEDTNPRRWEQALPIAVANVSKAYRQWKEGAEKMRGGAELIEFDRNDPEHMAELAAQSLGFRLTRSGQAWDLRIAQLEASAFWDMRRTHLLSQYDLARQGGVTAEVDDMLEDIKRYNKQVPFPELAISRDTLSRSIKMRAISRARRSAGIPDAKYLTGVYKELERLYPDPERISEGQEPAR